MGDGIQHDVLLIVATVLFVSFVLQPGESFGGRQENFPQSIFIN